MAAGWFALLTRRCPQRGAFAGTDALKAAIQVDIDRATAEPRPFVWTKSADDILASVERFRQRSSSSNH